MTMETGKTTLPPVRIHGFPAWVREPFRLFDNDIALKAHIRYKDAKSGNEEAAEILVSELAVDFIVRIRDQLPANAIFVAPHAREATGDNAIPQILAVASALAADGETDTDIVQITRVFHTGADPMERMILKPEFDGAVTDGANYILVDDVTSMGCTLAELSNYIQCAGGIVIADIILVNAGRSKHFHPADNVINKIEKRFGNEIRELFGIVPVALTANEANYIIGFRSADEIRNRMAKAKKETNLRLRSKGIERQDQISVKQIFTAK